jgi:hypothetical protein
MMSYSNSLRFREAGSLISFTVIRVQDYDPLLASRTGSTVFLPHLATATELLVIDLVAQHNVEPNPELASGRDSRFPQSLLCQLAPVEALQLRVSAHRVHGRLAPEKAQQGVALFAPSTEPLRGRRRYDISLRFLHFTVRMRNRNRFLSLAVSLSLR